MLVSGSAVIVYCLGVFIHWSKFCVSEEVLLLVEQLVVQTTWGYELSGTIKCSYNFTEVISFVKTIQVSRTMIF